MLDDERTPGIGHNQGAAFEDVSARLEAFIEGANTWEKRGKLGDAEIAALDLDDMGARLNDYLSGARALWGEADAARKAEKQPHLDAQREVDGKWKPLLDKLEAVGLIGKQLLARILKQKDTIQRANREAAELAQREAEAKAEEARLAAEKAGTVKARLDAQEIADQHTQAAAAHAGVAENNSGKARVASATGRANTRALRLKRTPRIVSLAMALSHYRDAPAIRDAILQLAAQELRSAPTERGVKRVPTIPGIAWDESEEV